MHRSFAPAVLGLGLSLLLLGADWPRFRGPDGSGSSPETGLATEWSESKNLAWKTALPGPGSSSPIAVKGRIFVTCYSGYALDRRDPGDVSGLKRHVICVDAKDGKVLWDKSIDSKQPEVAYRGIGVPNHGYASSTPVTDGERVYAFFGRTGVVAYDVEGKEAWRAEIAQDPRTHDFGTASSPILWEDLVIVPASIECESIVAFDKKSGKEAWRATVEGYGPWWGTPILVESGGRKDLVVSLPGEIWGINPKTGKLRWNSASFRESNICPSPVAAGGVVYATGGRQAQVAAVRAGGKGDASKENVIWSKQGGSYINSPVVDGGHLYYVTDRGIANCMKAETGESVYQERLEDAGMVYASPLLADRKIYIVTRRSGTFVLDANPQFKVIARNRIAGDDSDFNASPAVSDGKIYLRSDRALYALKNN